jgi:hypothetical protein
MSPVRKIHARINIRADVKIPLITPVAIETIG